MKKSLVTVAAIGAGVLALAAPGSAAPPDGSPNARGMCPVVTVGATDSNSSRIVVDGDVHYVALPHAVTKGGKGKDGHGARLQSCTLPPDTPDAGTGDTGDGGRGSDTGSTGDA